jgi:hypothetical protein
MAQISRRRGARGCLPKSQIFGTKANTRNVQVTRGLRSTAGKQCFVSAIAIKSRPRPEDTLAIRTGLPEGPTLDAAGSDPVTPLISTDGHVQDGVAPRPWAFPLRSAEEFERLGGGIEETPPHRCVGVLAPVMKEAHTAAVLHGDIFSPCGLA